MFHQFFVFCFRMESFIEIITIIFDRRFSRRLIMLYLQQLEKVASDLVSIFKGIKRKIFLYIYCIHLFISPHQCTLKPVTLTKNIYLPKNQAIVKAYSIFLLFVYTNKLLLIMQQLWVWLKNMFSCNTTNKGSYKLMNFINLPVLNLNTLIRYLIMSYVFRK